MKSGRTVRLVAFTALTAAVIAAVGAPIVMRLSGEEEEGTATVARGSFRVTLVEAGVLRPADSITYRSPLVGREAEVTFLAPEGLQVRDGDLIARLDDSEVVADLERAIQVQRQARVEQQIAEADRAEAQANLDGVVNGEGALTAEEARTALRLAERKHQRLKEEHDGLVPLLARGYVTREELDRAALALEEAEAAVDLARRKAAVITGSRQPRDEQRARAVLAQRNAQREQASLRLSEADTRASALRTLVQACSLYARREGLVVHEENFSTSPRRKVRVGDRVTASQGLVTIPELNRMQVATSARERDIHTIKPTQAAHVFVEAFPGAVIQGRIVNVGGLARASQDRPLDDKRFDVTIDLQRTDAPLRPDMTARVEIAIDEVRNALLLPVNAVFERDGTRVVHLTSRWGVETRTITVGRSNGVHVEVLSGLGEGDRVRLRDEGTR